MNQKMMNTIILGNELLRNNEFPNKNSIDIHEHLETLTKYAFECDSVFETGVRSCVSSWAFVYGLLSNNNGKRKTLFMNDINECNVREIEYVTKPFDIKIKKLWKNNLLINFDSNYDLTFIDTWHVYAQLKRELEKFSKITNKYMILHDTTIDEWHGETIRNGWDAEQQSKQSGFPIEEINKGLWPAVTEFIANNPDWYIKERFTNNNGLTILAKIIP